MGVVMTVLLVGGGAAAAFWFWVSRATSRYFDDMDIDAARFKDD
jgi:hypothetical protein